MNGILIIDKPAGITSHDVVSRLRRILKTKSIGHTGTLDPFATGVLVMLVGKATRLARFLDKDEKEYEAVVRFGFETDTGDVTGERKGEGEMGRWGEGEKGRKGEDFGVEISEIEKVLPKFRGEIWQTPPMYSAKKVKGKKLYELARKGVEIEREAVKVKISKLEILSEKIEKNSENSNPESQNLELETWNLKLRVACSAGTYIRTLAEDIGKKVGIGAHLSELRRIRAGIFDLEKAVTLEELEKIVENGKISEVFISMNDALKHLPKIVLSEKDVEKTRNGMKFFYQNSEISDNQAIRMTGENDNLAAIGFYNAAENFVQPKVVLV